MHFGRALIAGIMLAFSSSGAYAAESGCVTCHGDEGVLKSLFRPAKPATSEGEG